MMKDVDFLSNRGAMLIVILDFDVIFDEVLFHLLYLILHQQKR